MPGKRIGYIRVSSIDQNPERQLQGLDLDKKFIEHASAATTKRPQLQAMLEYCREDDVIYVHSMDRLARNLYDLRKLVNDLVSRKIKVVFMKENLTFDGSENAMSVLLLSMMGAFAEFELAFIRERQAEGIAIAKKQGKFIGRKPKFTPEIAEKLKEGINSRMTRSELARQCGIGRTSLYTYAKRIGITL